MALRLVLWAFQLSLFSERQKSVHFLFIIEYEVFSSDLPSHAQDRLPPKFRMTENLTNLLCHPFPCLLVFWRVWFFRYPHKRPSFCKFSLFGSMHRFRRVSLAMVFCKWYLRHLFYSEESSKTHKEHPKKWTSRHVDTIINYKQNFVWAFLCLDRENTSPGVAESLRTGVRWLNGRPFRFRNVIMEEQSLPSRFSFDEVQFRFSLATPPTMHLVYFDTANDLIKTCYWFPRSWEKGDS